MFAAVLVAILLTFVSLFMILLVLIQKPADEGFDMTSGASMQRVVDVVAMPSLLHKITYGTLALLFVLTLLLAYLLQDFGEVGDLLSE